MNFLLSTRCVHWPVRSGIDKQTKNDEAVLLFTSGSESMPKGVPLTHGNILANQRAALKMVELYTDDVFLAFLPPFHSFGFTTTGTLGLLCGVRTAYYPDPTDGKGLAKAVDTWKATITCGAPTFVKAMLKAADPKQLETLRLCITGAEKTPQDLIELAERMGIIEALVEGYGITECSPIISGNIPGEPLRGVGKPIPGLEIMIVHHETHQPVLQGDEGLILVRGESIFKGYLNPGLASPFIVVKEKEWYRSVISTKRAT